MSVILELRCPWKTKIIAATLFLACAVSGVSLIRHLAGFILVVALPGISVFTFVLAFILLFVSPRIAFLVAFLSGLAGLYWFFHAELANFTAVNSWIALNLPDTVGTGEAPLRIVFGTLLIVSTVFSLNAQLPEGMRFGQKAIRECLWLPLAIGLLLVSFWYSKSVSPYRVPIFADGPPPELAILHLQKNGLRDHETRISVYPRGQYYFARSDRELFQYRFASNGGTGVLPMILSRKAKDLADKFATVSSPTRIMPIRAWRGEGWYLCARSKQKVLAFTTEDQTSAPQEVVDLFQEFLSAMRQEGGLPDGKDICFGFCYDAVAGLGLANLNDRCLYDNGTRCQ